MKFQIRKVIDEGSWLPWGYGIAWDDYDSLILGKRLKVVCYPVPLNYIFACARTAYRFLAHARILRSFSYILHKEMMSYRYGYERGWTDAMEQYERRLAAIEIEVKSSTTQYVLPMSRGTQK